MCYNIKGTIENDTVKEVRKCAFGFCAQITSINFPACMTVGDGAFGITGLKPKQVTLAEGCSIGKGAFEITEINDLINDINYVSPYFDTEPYEYDINHDDKISEDEKGVTVRGFKKGIKEGAFYKNGKVTIPCEIGYKPVLAIGTSDGQTVSGFDQISTLDLTQAKYLKVIEDNAFYADVLQIFSPSKPQLMGAIESDTVKVIGYSAFCNNSHGITSISFPALKRSWFWGICFL